MCRDDVVRIQPVGLISSSQWESVLDWWAMGERYNLNITFIDVSIEAFTQRKVWLREGWKSLGNDLVIEDDVKLALKVVEGSIKEFLTLSATDNSNVRLFDLSTIKLQCELTSFQKKNVANLLAMPNGANFSVPGAGKTLTTLAVWEYLRLKGFVSRLLVICPRSAFEAWENDVCLLTEIPNVAKFTDVLIDSTIEILYVNYEQLENNNKLKSLTRWVEMHPTMLVLDEAYRVKSGGAVDAG